MPSLLKEPRWEAYKRGYRLWYNADYFIRIVAYAWIREDASIDICIWLPQDMWADGQRGNIYLKVPSMDDAKEIIEYMVNMVVKHHKHAVRPDVRGDRDRVKAKPMPIKKD